MSERFILDSGYYEYDGKPTMLLHACCASCSSSVIECLKDFFEITVLFYNPNIYPYEEYVKRKNELIKYLNIINIPFIDSDYDSNKFDEVILGYENECEGEKRCEKCISLRLKKTFELGNDYNYICSTLSVSPHKNSKMINDIGARLEKEYGIKYLISDFKKKDGYKRSIELSKLYGLYRQNYCGCKYSMRKD